MKTPILLILIVLHTIGVCQSIDKIAYSYPTEKLKISSNYGMRKHPISGENKFHYGIDIITNKSKIRSVLNGIIVKAEYDKKLGFYVKIKHKNIYTIYGHLSKIKVIPGQKVVAGELIGISGSSGQSTSDHLHFAIKFKSKFINPNKLFDKFKIL